MDYFFAAYLPAMLLIFGSALYVIGQSQRMTDRTLASRVRPKLSVDFRVLFPQGWRAKHDGWRKSGFYLELAGLILALVAFFSLIAYWVWFLYFRSG